MPVVTAHGVAVHSQHGLSAARRLEQAMRDAIVQCNQEGISNAEENSDLIRHRMRQAHQKVLLEITKEEYAKFVEEATATYQARLAELTRAHEEHLANAERSFADEINAIESSIDK